MSCRIENFYPPSLWNQRDVASSGLARITNSIEGWRYCIKPYFSGLHPSKWKVVANLQKDASVQKLKFYITSSGHQFTKKRKNTGRAEYYASLRIKNEFAFLSRYGNLELNICSFVLCLYFQFKTLFLNFFLKKRRFLTGSRDALT